MKALSLAADRLYFRYGFQISFFIYVVLVELCELRRVTYRRWSVAPSLPHLRASLGQNGLFVHEFQAI